MDWKFYLSLAVSIACMVLAYQQVRLMKMQMATQGITSQSPMKHYWPLVVMAILVIGIWVPYLIFSSSGDYVPILIEWGGTTENCEATLNSGPLVQYREHYGVAVVCGFRSPGIDKYEDSGITVSPLFTIDGGRIEINTPRSPAMSEAYKNLVDQTRKSQGLQADAPVLVPWSVWLEVILLPKGSDPRNIHRLSDVLRSGGKILGYGRGMGKS